MQAADISGDPDDIVNPRIIGQMLLTQNKIIDFIQINVSHHLSLYDKLRVSLAGSTLTGSPCRTPGTNCPHFAVGAGLFSAANCTVTGHQKQQYQYHQFGHSEVLDQRNDNQDKRDQAQQAVGERRKFYARALAEIPNATLLEQ
jgi:hypothetical protein